MDISLEGAFFYALLLDSIGANIVVWLRLGDEWYTKHLPLFSKYFPTSRGWATLYLAFVLWVGSLLFRLGLI